MARPTKYSKELADKICEQLALGESMRTVCKAENMPAMSTVFKWLREEEGFSEQYAKAKEESADAMAEDLLHIADTPVMGEIKTIKPDGSVEIKKDEMLGHRRLQVDTRKWLMAKMKPKKYGDKMQLGNDPDNPLTNPTKELTDEELNARIREIIASKEG